MTALFWIALIVFTTSEGDESMIGSRQQKSYAECQELVIGETGLLMQGLLEDQGATITDKFCVPVTERHREPMVGGAPT